MTTLAYSHTLVAGTPENINDVQDMFNDVKTLVNGNLDATNLATAAKPATLMGAYRTVAQGAMLFSSASASSTYYPTAEGGTITPPAVGVATSGTPMVIPITLADYAVSGLTTQFRVQAVTITNPTASAVNFTFGLQQVIALGGGASTITIATVSASLATVTRTAPAASSLFSDATSDFTISSSGGYILTVVPSGAPAANSRVVVTLSLQVHHI